MTNQISHHHHKNNHEKPPQPQIPTANTLTQLLWFTLISTSIKLLLIPSYHSTDLEVHRNWLAITHTLPLTQWYSDETSPWTLDYPPFFAYFERFLSLFATYMDPTIVHLHDGLNYKSPLCILFQRLSVILSDFVLIYAVYKLTKDLNNSTKRVIIWVIIVWSPMLVIVDHIHFQYNGFLLGLLLLSISSLEGKNDLFGGLVFAVLICFKHLFAVAAPVYFVYLLRHYCRGGLVKGFGKLMLLGSIVVAIFAAAYGPFLYYGQIQQVLRRMFPFGRGLCHAYWAPNFWVFYINADKVFALLFAKLGFNIQAPSASFTGGLVGDSSPFAVLPNISPLISLIIVLLAMSPCLIKAWKNPQPKMMGRWVSYAYTCGFLFGWHVHEKASLHFIIPMASFAMESSKDAKNYFFVSIVSCYSLFPLLFEAQEYPIKVLLLLLHAGLMWFGFSSYFSIKSSEGFVIRWFGKCYLLGLLCVEVWGQVLHPLIFGENLPFLPLLIISTYSALGIFYSWILQLSQIIRFH